MRCSGIVAGGVVGEPGEGMNLAHGLKRKWGRWFSEGVRRLIRVEKENVCFYKIQTWFNI